jgi:hypothetical protein
MENSRLVRIIDEKEVSGLIEGWLSDSAGEVQVTMNNNYVMSRS